MKDFNQASFINHVTLEQRSMKCDIIPHLRNQWKDFRVLMLLKCKQIALHETHQLTYEPHSTHIFQRKNVFVLNTLLKKLDCPTLGIYDSSNNL